MKNYEDKNSQFECLLKDQIETLIYKYTCAKYNKTYSTASYTEEYTAYKNMLAPLITLAKHTDLILHDITSGYCGLNYTADYFSDFETLTEYW